MEDLRFYDFSGNLLHIENHIISANWRISYNKIGTFEGHFPLESDLLPVVMQQPYLLLFQGEKQAIVTGKRLGEDFTLYGRTLNFLLSKRAVTPFATEDLPSDKNVQSLAHWLIGKGFDEADRLICKVNTAVFPSVTAFENTKACLLDELICDLLAQGKAGHRISFDRREKQWVFEVLLGQEIPLILSESSRNAYEMEYTEDLQGYYSGGWYEKREENGSRIWTQIPSSQQGILRWTGVLQGDTEDEAKRSLQKKKWEKALQAKVKGLPFSFDYSMESYARGECHLGDLVRVQKEFGKHKITEQKRITGMDFWYETNQTGMQPVLEQEE